ncbi:MAG: NrfD/PsrC family molybdoenzyme membrane anchor subunit [candidate division KSB1 bacterium]|nr:NrfD/PsrC family molybdoenzyme membrane anchor subunit [candidate division KSB1 bacterium]MDQ7063340.1 NrfD/PsrC family molybdoenzyme membrane anchor subunit [candidate division KSB1 bacterium]
MNFGFVIDNRKCIGCHACTVACKAEHDVPLGVNRTWVKYIEKGEFPNTRRLFSVMRCNHCEDAPCVDICPVAALYTRPDGIVDFDNQRCIGCKSCMQACPYDALYIDPESHTAAKCNYCAHRIDIGLEPACVNVCPEHAIISGDLDDPTSEIAQLIAREQVQARKVEKGTKPKLFYIDGDAASLVPGMAPPSTNYIQTEQTSGVGHFVKFAEQRLQEADPQKMAQQLAGNGSQVSAGSPEDYGVKVPEMATGGSSALNKAWAVVREQARRVYDAPSKGILWGWEVSSYVWTKAIAAGTFMLIAFDNRFNFASFSDQAQWASWAISLIFLALTGLLLIKDLDQPKRFLYVLLRPQWNSWLVRGGYFITLFGGVVTLWGLAHWQTIGWLQVATEWLGLALGVMVAVYTAFLFAQAKGRDFWQTPTLPLHMLVNALLAGEAVLAILNLLGPVEDGFLFMSMPIAMIFTLLANLAILAAEIFITHPTSDARLAVEMIIKGRFAGLFYVGVLLVGNLIPLAMLLLGLTGLMPVIGALILIGLYCTEHIWVRAPQYVPLA